MLTVNIATDLTYRDTLYHKTLKNTDNSPARCRVNGICKTWKTRPDDFKLPVKYGLKNCFYITPFNADEWVLTEKDAIHGITITHDLMKKKGKIRLSISKATEKERDDYYTELKNEHPDIHYVEVPFYKIMTDTGFTIFRSYMFHISKHNCHNLKRLNFWFYGPDGYIWYGFTIGNNGIAYCKKTRKTKW